LDKRISLAVLQPQILGVVFIELCLSPLTTYNPKVSHGFVWFTIENVSGLMSVPKSMFVYDREHENRN
jgi:hypothetical protein